MKRWLVGAVCLSMFFFASGAPVYAQGAEDELADLKAQVGALLKRIESLEAQQAAAKAREEARTQEVQAAKDEVAKVKEEMAKAPKAEPINVIMDKAASKLKIKGRYAAGYFDSQRQGSYPDGSFVAPEAKVQFAFQPDDINTIIMRMNLNNAVFNNVDYFYLDTKDPISQLKGTPFNFSTRLGRFKFPFGEETWSNNPVESSLISNSAANVAGYDEGLMLFGKVGEAMPLGWQAELMNGNSGAPDNANAKGFATRVTFTPITPLFLSASYYTSGRLKTAASEMSIAGLTSRPGSAANWKRRAFEFDARYDFERGAKFSDSAAYADSKAILKLAYGAFEDSDTEAFERYGDYGFVEATYNLTPKFYSAFRFSLIDLDGETTASLNGITANRYGRYSVGSGYRLSKNTILKTEYSWNQTDNEELNSDSDDNQFAAVVSAQF